MTQDVIVRQSFVYILIISLGDGMCLNGPMITIINCWMKN